MPRGMRSCLQLTVSLGLIALVRELCWHYLVLGSRFHVRERQARDSKPPPCIGALGGWLTPRCRRRTNSNNLRFTTVVRRLEAKRLPRAAWSCTLQVPSLASTSDLLRLT